jgi:hypothetical protein
MSSTFLRRMLRAEMFKGLGGNDTVDGGAGTDTCQKDTADKNLNCP